jgi:hypothetical protein
MVCHASKAIRPPKAEQPSSIADEGIELQMGFTVASSPYILVQSTSFTYEA